MKRIVWEGRSSALLYIFHYLFFVAVAIGLKYIDPVYSLIPTIIAALFVIDALSMKYEVSEEEVYFSGSVFDRESAVVPLKDILGFYIIDEPPWNFFSLGTVIIITDMTSNEHPCIKCVKDPEKLAKLIKRQAIKQGALLEVEIN